MRIEVITIFPEMVETYVGGSIIGKAKERGILDIRVHDLREHASDRHRTTDDSPYGGGPGMVMKAEPIARAFESILGEGVPSRSVLVTPQGVPFTQGMAEELSREERRLIFLCGRYEGIDERVVDRYIDDEISVGDYVLTGGELPALVIIDASVRLLRGVVGDEGSLEDESFSWGILDYPHFTRPLEWDGARVPEVLVSGNHREVERYRRKEALRRTMRRRPDLLEKVELSKEDESLLSEIKEEEGWTS